MHATPRAAGRIEATFAKRTAFVPFLSSGYPGPRDTPRLLMQLAQAGADVIELGLPFSDPLADGPAIQTASARALDQGVTAASALDQLAEVAPELPPIVIFTYLNPVLRMGPEKFVEKAAEAGAAGLLLTDLPVGADPGLAARLGGGGLDLIPLAAPTTSDARLKTIADSARGFLYYIARTGVTGSRTDVDAELSSRVTQLRGMLNLPVAVGFGIATPDQARTLASVADGVVVGTALIKALGTSEAAFCELAEALAEAVRANEKQH